MCIFFESFNVRKTIFPTDGQKLLYKICVDCVDSLIDEDKVM